MEKNKTIWILAGLVILMAVFGFGKLFVEIVANRVIVKLQKEYSPSPYGPGINPDLIDSEKIKNPR